MVVVCGCCNMLYDKLFICINSKKVSKIKRLRTPEPCELAQNPSTFVTSALFKINSSIIKR